MLKQFEQYPKTHTRFRHGDLVYKVRGSKWRGKIVGWYSTSLTEEGYCVESSREHGSVQIYPESALAKLPEKEVEDWHPKWPNDWK